MTVPNQTIQVPRGDTMQLSVTVTMPDGTPYDPGIDASFKWRVSRNWHSPEEEALVRKELGTGIVRETGGLIVITLDATDTDRRPGVYYHELKAFGPSDVATAMTGAFVVKPSMRMEVLDPDPLSAPRHVLSLMASVP